MTLEDDLFLISAKGLGVRRATALRQTLNECDAVPHVWLSTLAPRELHLLLQRADGGGRGRRGVIQWPSRRRVEGLADRMRRRGVRVVWRDSGSYPGRVAQRMGEAAPPWLLVQGEASRLEARQCAIIGSRTAPAPFCRAAFRLARALAGSGLAVTSGLARGADEAAHAGAVRGEAGTVGVPARGLLRLACSADADPAGRLTLLGSAHPEAPFHAGLAVRRNRLIAALADTLVLVASGLRGGSAYALRWALARGTPVWCFEGGSGTPAGNASLLSSGLAQPLSLDDSPSVWAERVRQSAGRDGGRPGRSSRARLAQLDWLA